MPRGESRFILRLGALALVIPLLWLAQQAGREGIAGVYAASAAGYQQAMRKVGSQSAPWLGALAQGKRNIALARQAAPAHPAYMLQEADLGFDQPGPGAAVGLLRAALANEPVRADIWSRLARYGYEFDGLSVNTLHALDRALYFGPRQEDVLLLNATITLNAGAGLDDERRLRGWDGIVRAVGMPGLAGPVNALVKNAGMQRQLQGLLREKEQLREALEWRETERGGAR